VPDDFPYLDRVFVTSPGGTLMVDMPELPGVRGRNFEHRGWYQGVSREWTPYISDVYQRAAEPQIHVFAVAVPIEGIEDSVTGILVLQISLDTFFEWTKHVDTGSAGVMYVVDRQGNVAFHPGSETRLPQVDSSQAPAVRGLLQGGSGTEILFDETRGEDMMVSYGPMPRYGWGIAMTEPAKAVFAAKNALFRRILVSDALVILLAFGALYMAFRVKGQRIQAQLDRQAKIELEEEVARRTLQLQVANKELEGFSYSVSHDLRAPLRAIDGFSMILEEDCADKLGDYGRQKLGRIRENARRMGELIDDILRLSRLGCTAVNPARVNLDGQVHEIVRDLLAQDGVDSVRFTIEPLPEAWCDQALVRQVWENLLSNAVKFTGQKQARQVMVGAMEEAGETVYFVRDNGSGFDMKYYEKLFGVFQRLHSMDEFPGTGVGLAIVRRIVASHGGRVWAQSTVGQGATFYFTLSGPPP
jgi:signal transduction histidine kinase